MKNGCWFHNYAELNINLDQFAASPRDMALYKCRKCGKMIMKPKKKHKP